MNKKRLRLIGSMVALFFLAFASAFAAEGPPTRGGSLKVGWVAQAKNFDPHKSVFWPERYVMYCVFETLVGVDEAFNITPKLALSWKNPDSLTFLFNLRKGVKFHDGTDFDASAVKWNIERIINPEFASPQREMIEPFVKSVEVVDTHTVKFNLKMPYAPFLSILADRAGCIVSPSAVKKLGEKRFAINPVGTGPFQFESWTPQAQLNLKRFDGYWDKGKPYLDRIEFQEIPDPMVRQTMLRTGAVDIISDISPKEAVELKNEGKVKVVKNNNAARWYALCWQVDKPPFNNRALREAVAYAIDREEINKKLFYGETLPATGPVTPGLWWYDESFKGYQFNPEMVKKKLAEAGYPNGFSYRFTVPNTQFYVQFCEALQAQLAKQGIKMEFEMVSQSEATARIASGQTNWTMTNWTQRPDPHGLLGYLFDSKGFSAQKRSKYNNPKVDELLDEAASSYDKSKRTALYHQLARIITNDAPYVYILFFPDWVAMKPNVKGFSWIPDLIPRYAFLWKEKS